MSTHRKWWLRKLTEEEVNERYAKLKSMAGTHTRSQCAAELAVSVSTVDKLCAEAGIKCRSLQTRAEFYADKEPKIRALAADHTAQELADKLGIARSTVYKICKDFGITYARAKPKYPEDLVQRGTAMAAIIGVRRTAKKLGVTKGAVESWCYRKGVTAAPQRHSGFRPAHPAINIQFAALLAAWKKPQTPYYRNAPVEYGS